LICIRDQTKWIAFAGFHGVASHRKAPFDRDLELAVIEYYGTDALVFPCRRILNGWLKSGTQEQIYVRPTHWREWKHVY
jgi:hypothetical protein